MSAPTVEISITTLTDLLSAANLSRKGCFEVLSISSCSQCPARKACPVPDAIEKGEKLLEQIQTR